MEKPFENRLDEQQLDALLRGNFLALEDSAEQTKNLHDMNAQIVFGAEPAVALSPAKEKAFLRRIGAALPKTRWWLNGLLLLLPLAALILALSWRHHAATVSAAVPAGQAAASPAVTTGNEAPAKEDIYTDGSGGLVTAGAPVGGTSAALADSVPADSAQAKRPVALAPYNSRTGYIPPVLHDEDLAGGNDTIPVLTESDRKKYAKQKKIMIEQVINAGPFSSRRARNEAFVYVPMGSFHFGDTLVSVQAFYMQQAEVSNLQYRTFLYDLVAQGRTEDYLKARVRSENWSKALKNSAAFEKYYFTHPQYDRYPAVNIPREGADMYCVWLTQEVNKERQKRGDPLFNDLRVPTEQEWEYAAHGGIDTSNFPWGTHSMRNRNGCYLSNIMLRPGNYSFASKCGPNGQLDSAKTVAANALGDKSITCDVYAFNPNNYGLYCTIGNAAEMVWTWTMKNPKDKRAKSKGGSWRDHEDEAMIHTKNEYEGVTEASPYIGFRPVVTYLARPKN